MELESRINCFIRHTLARPAEKEQSDPSRKELRKTQIRLEANTAILWRASPTHSCRPATRAVRPSNEESEITIPTPEASASKSTPRKPDALVGGIKFEGTQPSPASSIDHVTSGKYLREELANAPDYSTPAVDPATSSVTPDDTTKWHGLG